MLSERLPASTGLTAPSGWTTGRIAGVDTIPSHWEIAALRDVARLESGHTPSRQRPEYWGGTVPWLSLHDSKLMEPHVISATALSITEAGLENSSARRLPAGTVALSRTATIGKAVILGREMATSQDFACYVCGSKLDNVYLLHLFRHMQHTWDGLSGGSTHKTIYMPIFRRLQIPLPPLPEQRKIAAILSSVDAAIHATQAVIKLTRRVKEGLLRELLTRGVGRNGRPHTRYRQTEVGELPEPWVLTPLNELLSEEIQNGYSPVCPDDPNGRWVLALGALGDEGLDPSEVKPAPRDDPKIADFLLRPGDVLVSRSNTVDRVGRSILFRGEISNCAYPDLMMRFRVDESKARPRYIEQYLRGPAALSYLRRSAAGTSGSMVKINKRTLQRLPVALPPLDEQDAIADAVEAVAVTARSDTASVAKLEVLKNGLLQDLLTGKVRVKV